MITVVYSDGRWGDLDNHADRYRVDKGTVYDRQEGKVIGTLADPAVFPPTWTPILSESVDSDDPPVWFVCKGVEDHSDCFGTKAEAAICADELNRREVTR